MPDVIETWIGSDPELPDTDGDGLTDAYEYFVCFTDLTKADTDDNGISDGEEDLDGDGLTNIQECQNGTHPLIEDTDGDDLSDSEEVNSYLTDPNEKDTDGDGAEDGWEVKNGFDPKVYNESFEILAEAEDENLKASVSLEVSGNQAASLTVEKADDIILIDDTIPGYIGSPFRFEIDGEFERATLSFTFDSALLDSEDFEPAIFYYNEETQLFEELPTTVNGNVASAVTTHFSVYVLLNKTKFYKAWKTILAPGKEMPETKVAFTVDVSGSMAGTNIETARTVITKFLLNSLFYKNTKTALISFNSTASVISELSSSPADTLNALEQLKCDGGTAIYTGLNSAINMLKPKFQNDIAYNTIILLTDGEDDPPVGSGMYKHCIELANEANTSIFTVSIGVSTNQLLIDLADGTGGKYFYAEDASHLYEIYEEIESEVTDYTEDSNDDGISDYYSKLLCDGTLRVGSYSDLFNGISYEKLNENNDYDGDGIPNGEELEIRVDEKTGHVYAYLHSNPFVADTDSDGLYDSADDDPFDPDTGFKIFETKKNYEDLKKFSFEDRPEDFQYADKTIDELRAMKFIYWGNFLLHPAVFHEMEWKSLMRLGTIGKLEKVAIDMVNHFIGGTGRDYSNAELNKKISEYEDSSRYADEVCDIIDQYIKEHNGDISGLTFDKNDRSNSYMADKMDGKVKNHRYLDLKGLALCVDNIYGCSIEITSYSINGDEYEYKLRFDMCDIFGLDSGDIEVHGVWDDRICFGIAQGFRSWYILQHYDKFDGKYKPFVTVMSFERTHKGTLNYKIIYPAILDVVHHSMEL